MRCERQKRPPLPPALRGPRAGRRASPPGASTESPRAQPAREHRCKVAWRGRWPPSREHQVPGREQQRAGAARSPHRYERGPALQVGPGRAIRAWAPPGRPRPPPAQSPRYGSRSPFRSPLRRRTVAFPGKQPPALTAKGVICKEQAERGLKTSGSRMLVKILKDVGQAQDEPPFPEQQARPRTGPNRAEMEGWFNNANASWKPRVATGLCTLSFSRGPHHPPPTVPALTDTWTWLRDS